jgi:hypothetical protein
MLNRPFKAWLRTDCAGLNALPTRRLSVTISGAVGGLLALAATFNQVEPATAFESARWLQGVVVPFLLGVLAGVLGAIVFESLGPGNARGNSPGRRAGSARTRPAWS